MKTFRILGIGLLIAVLTACSPASAPEVTADSSKAASSPDSEATATEQPAQDEAVETAEPETTESESEPEVNNEASPSETPSTAPKTETKQPSPTPTSTKTPTPSPTPTETPTTVVYTKAQVAQKNSRTACWAIVSGSVYNLTDWINKHPGGASAIASLCGVDATEAFEGKHGGDARPSSVLESYYLGPLTD